MSSKITKENLIKQFRGITNATQNDASRILKQNGYRLEASVDAFYNDDLAIANANKGASSSDKKAEKETKDRLGSIFDQYKDEDGDEITMDGALRMFQDLDISPEDVVLLPLSFYLKSPSLGTFQKAQYIEGWKAIAGSEKVDSIQYQKKLLPRLREELKKDAAVRDERGAESKSGLFHRVYEFTYTFAREEGQKSLSLDSALAFWDLLMPSSPTYGDGPDHFSPRQLELWKEFLTEKGNGRAISKDTWLLFLDFTKEIDSSFKSHDFDAAWPSQIDEFVEWAKGKLSGEAMDES
ncbi:hypothetical protein CBS101457_000882 [Exobasidium rhododendri]|nr:hypothetical protein CBS101457_000882 [Exobasidium rhododendri]